MFENFRDKIQNVQSLSSGLLDLSIGDKKIKEPIKDVNLDAGFALLSWHQSQWSKLHKISELNAKYAEKTAKQLDQLESTSTKHKIAIKNFLTQCETIPQLEENIDMVKDDLISLKKNILQLEETLDEMYLRRELENCIQFKLDQKYRYNLYKERKNNELEALRTRLAADHAKKIKEYERLELLKSKERQLLYQAAFEEELNFYKTHGMLTKPKEEVIIEKKDETKPLEEIEVEPIFFYFLRFTLLSLA